MFLRRKTGRFKKFEKRSYSQCGEDIIAQFIFNARDIQHPTYIDIGANHPYSLNNTAIFYNDKSLGINIEPNAQCHELFDKFRPDDINLNVGIGPKDDQMTFYQMANNRLSTFMREEMIKLVEDEGMSFDREVEVEVLSIETLLSRLNVESFPDFLSLDAEGLDEEIIESIDFKKWRPKVMCIETLTFSNSNRAMKRTEFIKSIVDRDYMVYADTYINTLFVDKNFK